MAIQILRQREVTYIKFYERVFNWNDTKGGGFGFPSDEFGNVNSDELNPAAAENYHRCVDGTYDVTDMGVRDYEQRQVEPRLGLCDCGDTVCLDDFTNTCDSCGTDYNSAGSRLAPRQQWGEETGERWHDCI